MGIFTSCGHFSPHMVILTLHGPFHLVWPLFTSCGHSRLEWLFLPCLAISHLAWPFVTSCGHSHLAWTFSPHVTISQLGIFTLHCHFSPCMAILISCHLACTPNTREQTSHLACILHAPLHAKIIFFTSCRKNSPNNHEATPIPSIRYLYEPPINF